MRKIRSQEKLIVNIDPAEKAIIVQAAELEKRPINSVARVGAVKEARRILRGNKEV